MTVLNEYARSKDIARFWHTLLDSRKHLNKKLILNEFQSIDHLFRDKNQIRLTE